MEERGYNPKYKAIADMCVAQERDLAEKLDATGAYAVDQSEAARLREEWRKLVDLIP